ncbi:hypothetical protein BY996DRAFT_7827285, partial [Phakopsora pachyrhizi]
MLSTLADLSIFSVLLVLAMAFCGVSVFSFPFVSFLIIDNTTMLISFFFIIVVTFIGL